MKTKRIFFIGVILGGLLGWMLGFLRFPYVERNSSFLLGFILSFTIILLLLYTVSLFKRSRVNNVNTVQGKNNFMPLLIFIIAAAGVILSVLLFKQNTSLKTQLTGQENKVRDLSKMIETAGSGNIAGLMNNILDEISAELKTEGMLSDSMINKIASLSYSFKPYTYFEGDSLSEKKMSPERGQLLIALLLLDIDSASFSKIKNKVTFAGANLNGADLHGVDLSYADLQGAHCKETILSGANLKGINLSDANLYAAKLDSAELSVADLKRTDLSWAVFHGADLTRADLNGAFMKNTQFISAELSYAKIQWASAEGTIFHKANLENANLMGTNLEKVNLSQANLHKADLRLVKLKDANVFDAEMNRAIVDSTWADSLVIWRLTNTKEILQKYQLKNDTADQWKNPLFRLNKKDED
ncbi:MAG: pentapeptide repeat-containing protein [Chitinophagales bacterium]